MGRAGSGGERGSRMNPKDFYYSKEHEWVSVDGDVATIGITDFAQGELGEVVFVELPETGAEIEAGDEVGSIESVKAASDIYAPISGEVVEVNEDLDGAPEKVNESPYDEGWICRIRIGDPNELEALMKSDEYDEMTSQDED